MIERAENEAHESQAAIDAICPIDATESSPSRNTFSGKSLREADARSVCMRNVVCAGVVGLAVFSVVRVSAATFEGLGDLPGSDRFSAALGVSSDGSTVVGMSRSGASGARTEAFVWTRARGLEALGDLGGGDFMSAAGAVSADGSVIVGISESAGGTEAFRWTRAGGLVGLGDLPGGQFNSGARGVSDDGSVVVGSASVAAGFGAFRWTAANGMQLVGGGDLVGGAFNGSAQTASGDGSVIYGSGVNISGPATFRWTATSGLSMVGELTGGSVFSEPFGASPDGRFCVGRSRSSASGANGFEAFRYDAVTRQTIGLGDLAGGIFSSIAQDVSADGSVVVGSATTARGEEAFIWDSVHGMRLLSDVLVIEYGIGLEGWKLMSANGISADGRVIVGGGINPQGENEAWMITIPAPSTIGMLAIIGFTRSRRLLRLHA